MNFPPNQIDELRQYCTGIRELAEAGSTYLYLLGLALPFGCEPASCDALLCTCPRDGYPSRLYFSIQVVSRYTRNWNVTNARIAERNWFAFSWRVDLTNASLAQLLVAHLSGFTKEK